MNHFYIVLAFLAVTACNNGVQNKPSQSYAEPKNPKVHITWTDSTINLGKVFADTTYEVQFQYTNTGTEPLILKKGESTCGCTVIENPSQEPVLPNAKGTIKAQLDTKQLEGIILKKIYVLSNAYKPFTVLRIKAEVIPGDS